MLSEINIILIFSVKMVAYFMWYNIDRSIVGTLFYWRQPYENVVFNNLRASNVYSFLNFLLIILYETLLQMYNVDIIRVFMVNVFFKTDRQVIKIVYTP